MYPDLRVFSVQSPALKEHFKLTVTDRKIIKINSILKNKLGFFILLKTFCYLGYFPRYKKDIPKTVIKYIASQLDVSSSDFRGYKWKNRTWHRHVCLIRDVLGFKPFQKKFYKTLTEYLSKIASPEMSRNRLFRRRNIKIKGIRFRSTT